MTNENFKQFIERAIEILEKAGAKNRNNLQQVVWLHHLEGYLQGGIEILELEKNDKHNRKT